MASVKLITGAAAAVLFLGISHRLSELCCTLEIVGHEKLCQWVGAIELFKTSFPMFLWGVRRAFSQVYTFSAVQAG